MNRRLNRKWSVAGLIAALLLLAACAVPAVPAADSGAPVDGSSDPFRIALIMPSTTTDMAWSQAMYDGILQAQAELGGESALELAVSENMFNVTDAAAAIRDYAADGYDLVIAHGAQYGEPMFDVAGDFPETSFAWGTSNNVGADRGLENVFAYEANAQEGAYVNGVIAALLTESNIIGVVGPVEAGDAVLYINGFKAGVADTNPDATVNVIFTGSFGDTALAAEAANTLIAGGADVLTGSAQQVVGAIGVATEAGVPWLSNDSDQSSLGPEVVVASQVYEWAETIKQMIEMHNAGDLGSTVFKLTLENEGLHMIFNPEFELPEEVRSAADTTIQSIIDGTVIPPR